MALVRIFGNTWLNPAFVGKIELQVEINDTSRKNITTVFDATGQHRMATCETTISLSMPGSDTKYAARDNFLHREIVLAIQEGRDAKNFDGPSEHA